MDVVRRVRDAITVYPDDPWRQPSGPDQVASPGAAPGGDPTTRPYPPAGGRGPWGGDGRRSWIFSAIWLAYLLPTVRQAIWHTDGLARQVAGVVIVLVFGVVYIFTFLVARKFVWVNEGTLTQRTQVLLLGGLLALTVAECVVIGEEGSAMLVYIAVACQLVLSVRQAWIGVGVLIVVAETSMRVIPGWDVDESLSFSIFLASLAIWGITQMIARNRQLAAAQNEIARMAVTNERSRFARDLHDLLGHSLTVMTVKAELAGRLMSIDAGRAEREINDVEQLARDALADVRAAVAGYREVSLAAELVSARTALDAAGILAELPGALDDVPGERRELFGWALREGVTNVVRHSAATRCQVLLTRSAIEVLDDGRGPVAPCPDGSGRPDDPEGQDDAEPQAGTDGPACRTGLAGQGAQDVMGIQMTGNGLLGLGERAEAVGASVTVGRAPGGGFRLRVGW